MHTISSACGEQHGESMPKSVEPDMYMIMKDEKMRPCGGSTPGGESAGVHSMTKAYMADSVQEATIITVTSRASAITRRSACRMLGLAVPLLATAVAEAVVEAPS